MTATDRPAVAFYEYAITELDVGKVGDANDAVRLLARRVGLDLDDQAQRDAVVLASQVASVISHMFDLEIDKALGGLQAAAVAAEIDAQTLDGTVR